MEHLRSSFDAVENLSCPDLSVPSRICLFFLLGLSWIVKAPSTLYFLLFRMVQQSSWKLNFPELQYDDGSKLHISEMPFSYGAFTYIYKGDRNGPAVAVKMWRPTSMSSTERLRFFQRVERGLMTWKTLTHPNIAPMLGVVQGFGNTPALATPFYLKGNITDYLRTNPTANLLYLLERVASAVNYMHNQKPPLPHGDIRGCNILITDEGEPLLTDIGINNLPQPPDWTISVGDATRWMAPELMSPDLDLSLKEDVSFATLKGDVYSFGMTMLEVYTRRVPFSYRKFYAPVVFDVVRGNRPPRPNCEELTDDIWQIITSCWQQEHSERPEMHTVEAWLQVLNGMRAVRG